MQPPVTVCQEQVKRGAPNRLPQSNARRLGATPDAGVKKATGSNCTWDIRSQIG